MSYALDAPTIILPRHTPFRNVVALACGSAAFALSAWAVLAATLLLG